MHKRLVIAVAAVVLFLFALPTAAESHDLSIPKLLVAKRHLAGAWKETIVSASPANELHVGFILNQPTTRQLGSLFPSHEPSHKVISPVYFGGPKGMRSLFAVTHAPVSPGPGSFELTKGLFMARNNRVIDKIIEERNDDARYFAGLVIWGAGELEEEIRRGFWHVLEERPALFFAKEPMTLWERLIDEIEVKNRTF